MTNTDESGGERTNEGGGEPTNEGGEGQSPHESTGSLRMTDSAYDAHLERSRSVWDRWSNHYRLSEQDFEPMRTEAIASLDLESGDRVLEIGCGPGVNFELLREVIGPKGEIIAVDYSPKMVEKARERVTARGWTNVEIKEADAATVAIPGVFDAAIATLSLSVMPGIRRVVENVYTSLSPGGEFVVFDLRPVPSGPLRIVNPLWRGFLYWFANWNREEDVLDSLEAIFDDVAVLETYMGGMSYTALARKAQ